MTVGTLRKEKLDLESDLLCYIRDRIEKFRKDTEYCPSSIRVIMRDCTCITDKNKQCNVADVITNIEVF